MENMSRPQPAKPSLVKRIVGKRLAPYLALGPISGPLTAGVVLNFRDGRPVLGSLYTLALGLWLGVAPLWAVHMLPATLAHFV
jgi:hypothetical protein